MLPRVREALLEQRKAFVEKFGREPGPDDPVFLDPDKVVPTPIDRARMDADLEKAIQDAGIDPAKAEVIRKLQRKRPLREIASSSDANEVRRDRLGQLCAMKTIIQLIVTPLRRRQLRSAAGSSA
jgi:hypothetical protein